MEIKVLVDDNYQEITPFKYKGFVRESMCSLRVHATEKNIYVLATQIKLGGTSITNAFEEVYKSVVEHILESNILKLDVKNNIFDIFMSKKRKRIEKTKAEISYLWKNIIWIEHYPPNTGLFGEESFSIVNSEKGGNPSWRYISKETLLNDFFDINKKMFDVDYNALEKLTIY